VADRTASPVPAVATPWALSWPRVTAAAIRSRTSRPSLLLVRFATAGLMNIIEAAGFALLVRTFGTLAGWTADQVLVLFGLAFGGEGICRTVAYRLDTKEFSALVRDGTFDQILTRPAPPLGWLIASSVEPRYLGRAVTGFALLAWASGRAGIHWGPAEVGVVALATICCAAVMVAAFVAGAAVTLRTVDGTDALNAFTYGGIYLASFPMEVHGAAVRAVFTWILPFGLTIYVPALVLLHKPGVAGLEPALLASTPAVTAVTCALAWLAWRAGVRRYLGTGS
jgi:ABC-2 type transport system permease protein